MADAVIKYLTIMGMILYLASIVVCFYCYWVGVNSLLHADYMKSIAWTVMAYVIYNLNLKASKSKE
jgi:Mg2+ and Co2+ transporter CorA